MDPESAGAMMVVQPRRSPEELAKLVSYLSNRQKAEITYDLVYFAAQAASENDCGALNVYLAELEDLAQVYGDPQQRRELQKTVKDVQRKTAY
jgi:hypothetical protein